MKASHDSFFVFVWWISVSWLCHISAAGLCDINEGSATSEDRCKSPTSGNMFFRVVSSLARDKTGNKCLVSASEWRQNKGCVLLLLCSGESVSLQAATDSVEPLNCSSVSSTSTWRGSEFQFTHVHLLLPESLDFFHHLLQFSHGEIHLFSIVTLEKLCHV